jgi:hypothetical protein
LLTIDKEVGCKGCLSKHKKIICILQLNGAFSMLVKRLLLRFIFIVRIFKFSQETLRLVETKWLDLVMLYSIKMQGLHDLNTDILLL